MLDGGLEYKGQGYHDDCFVCFKCKKSLSGMSEIFSYRSHYLFCVENRGTRKTSIDGDGMTSFLFEEIFMY